MHQHLAGCPARARLENRANDALLRPAFSVPVHRYAAAAAANGGKHSAFSPLLLLLLRLKNWCLVTPGTQHSHQHQDTTYCTIFVSVPNQSL